MILICRDHMHCTFSMLCFSIFDRIMEKLLWQSLIRMVKAQTLVKPDYLLTLSCKAERVCWSTRNSERCIRKKSMALIDLAPPDRKRPWLGDDKAFLIKPNLKMSISCRIWVWADMIDPTVYIFEIRDWTRFIFNDDETEF